MKSQFLEIKKLIKLQPDCQKVIKKERRYKLPISKVRKITSQQTLKILREYYGEFYTNKLGS